MKNTLQDTIFQVIIRGNFWGGKYYETGLDSIFVLATNKNEAMKIAKDNIDKVENHFRNKKYHNGKFAIGKKDKNKFKPDDVVQAKDSTQRKHNKTLTRTGKFKSVDLTKPVQFQRFLDEKRNPVQTKTQK
jgi:hypothetical protein